MPSRCSTTTRHSCCAAWITRPTWPVNFPSPTTPTIPKDSMGSSFQRAGASTAAMPMASPTRVSQRSHSTLKTSPCTAADLSPWSISAPGETVEIAASLGLRWASCVSVSPAQAATVANAACHGEGHRKLLGLSAVTLRVGSDTSRGPSGRWGMLVTLGFVAARRVTSRGGPRRINASRSPVWAVTTIAARVARSATQPLSPVISRYRNRRLIKWPLTGSVVRRGAVALGATGVFPHGEAVVSVGVGRGGQCRSACRAGRYGGDRIPPGRGAGGGQPGAELTSRTGIGWSGWSGSVSGSGSVVRQRYSDRIEDRAGGEHRSGEQKPAAEERVLGLSGRGQVGRCTLLDDAREEDQQH